MDKAVYSKFKSEVERWIENGWLVKTNLSDDGVIPLMAVVQEKKDKVRPVLNFRDSMSSWNAVGQIPTFAKKN